jgi:hypothetical protein
LTAARTPARHRGLGRLAAALCLAALPALAEVPLATQATLTLRILAFDRKLPARAQDAARFVVLYRQGDAASEAAMTEVAAALDAAALKNSVSGLPLKVERVGYSSAAKLEADLSRGRFSVAYLCPGLDDALPDIVKLTRSHSVLTFSGTEAYLKAGASVALVRRDAKAVVLVHLAHSRAEAADLDSALLRIAEVVL